MNTVIPTAYRGFRGREVTIMQMGKTNGSVLALRRHARTSRSGSVCDTSSFPQTSDKTFYGGNMHIEMLVLWIIWLILCHFEDLRLNRCTPEYTTHVNYQTNCR